MGNDLLKKKCVPCEGGTPPFTEEQIAAYKDQVKDWIIVENKKIQKTFKFSPDPSGPTSKDPFQKVVAFVNRVAAVANAEGHHPDIAFSYNKVEIELWTHAVGGLSENDFIMAAKIDALPLESATISIDEFLKSKIKIGKVLAAERVEGSDKLLKLSVDLGEKSLPAGAVLPLEKGERDIRTIVSGIAQYYQPDEVFGKMVPVISNLDPRTLKGIESNGMVLFGIDETGGGHVPVMLNPDKDLLPGSPVQ